tara:strand:- start:1810 stop:2112 length:303 start_codon:yes stop_codon:yes gene_type:complete
MDWLQIVERYGVPLVVAIAFWLFIQKQNKYIQDELSKELRESFGRVEGILIKLIDQQKKMQLEQKGIERSYRSLVEIMAYLSEYKDKFLRIQERNRNKKY